jgi:hypothetical protein
MVPARAFTREDTRTFSNNQQHKLPAKVRHFSEVNNLSYIQILAIPVFHNHTYVAISFGGRFGCSPIFGQGIIQLVEPFSGGLAKTFAFRDRYAHQQA